MARPIIVVLGGINMDLVTVADRLPAPGETLVGRSFAVYPGGKGANQAVAAAAMGARTTMVGRVGGDAFAQQLRGALAGRGVDVSAVVTDPSTSSGIAVIHIDASGQNRIVQILGANWTCGDAEVNRASQALSNASALMLQLEVPVEVSLRAAREAKARGAMVILDPGPPSQVPDDLFMLCDYITPNETEAEALVGFPVRDVVSTRAAAEELVRRGIGCAIIKMGAKGAFYLTEEEGRHASAFAVEAIDTVGAGDAFNGALAVALCEGKGLAEAVKWANAAGALAVTRVGAQDAMPRRREVESFLKDHGWPVG